MRGSVRVPGAVLLRQLRDAVTRPVFQGTIIGFKHWRTTGVPERCAKQKQKRELRELLGSIAIYTGNVTSNYV